MTRGEAAERRVVERLTGALRPPYRVLPNVTWTLETRPGRAASDGESDIVIVHPDMGILVVEVKAGVPTRQGGRWWLGPVELDESPIDQAKRNKYTLADAVSSFPGWPHRDRPIAGHAVAFPDADIAVPGHAAPWLGPDAPATIVLDATALADDASILRWVEDAYRFYVADGATRGVAPGPAGAQAIEDYLRPTITIGRRLGSLVRDDGPVLRTLSRDQARLLNQTQSIRRASMVGPAGSGKSMLAAERARRLARDGARTLLVCYNQRLATDLRRELKDAPQPAGMFVTTFHRLCEQLGSQARTLPEKPAKPGQDWWDEVLPDALDAAIDARPEMRFHAAVVDEGQDFATRWLRSLDRLLESPGEDVLWVFHDPGQALFRDDQVDAAGLGLTTLHLFENHRNPEPVAELAARLYRGGEVPVSYREGGATPRMVEAAPGRETLEALRKELHRLVHDEGVKAYDIAVLSGRSTEASEVWRQRRFGDLELVNAALEGSGVRKPLPPERMPEDPGDMPLFDSVRRFKGLEAPVVVLVELPDPTSAPSNRLDELLYVGVTRATTGLTVIAPPGLMGRFRTTPTLAEPVDEALAGFSER